MSLFPLTPLLHLCHIWQPFIRGEGVAFKDVLGTADYSVGDLPATHVRGLGLGPEYSFFYVLSSALGHGVADFIQNNVFLGVKKGVLAHFCPVSTIFAHFSAKTAFSSQKHPC